jgi:hypothetical protein
VGDNKATTTPATQSTTTPQASHKRFETAVGMILNAAESHPVYDAGPMVRYIVSFHDHPTISSAHREPMLRLFNRLREGHFRTSENEQQLMPVRSGAWYNYVWQCQQLAAWYI